MHQFLTWFSLAWTLAKVKSPDSYTMTVVSCLNLIVLEIDNEIHTDLEIEGKCSIPVSPSPHF